jgi:two-component system response regulator HydG
MPLALQAKLLDVLERGVIRAVGSNKERAVDVRIIAATHRDLRARVASGQFREDLLYRLEVVTLELPPLRHRKDDLPAFVDHFLTRARARHPGSKVERIAEDAMDRFLLHAWPGNLRELEHLIERLVLLVRSSEVHASDLPETVGAKRERAIDFGEEVIPLREMQRRYVAWAYGKIGRKLLTAEKLEIDDKTLAKWLAEKDQS